jgi:hypothetical protein
MTADRITNLSEPMNDLLELFTNKDSSKLLVENAPFYGAGFALGVFYLIPACLAIRMRPNLFMRVAPIYNFHSCISYVLGGAMYFGAIVFVYHASRLSITVPTITFLLLPYWPVFILRPMLWLQKVGSFMRRLSFQKQVRLNSKSKRRRPAARRLTGSSTIDGV